MARTIPPHTRIPAWHALALGVRFVVGHPRGSLPRPGPGAVLTVCESVRKISATEHATAIIKRRLTVEKRASEMGEVPLARFQVIFRVPLDMVMISG